MKIDNLSIVICILARDCARPLRRNIPRINKLLGAARDAHVIVVENDSVDQTKEILQQWAEQDCRVRLITKDHNADSANDSHRADRISRMASYRNAYIDKIQSEGITPDLVVMIDIDSRRLSVKRVINAIENAPADFAALFANGTRRIWGVFAPIYSDLYAYIPTWGAVGRTHVQMLANSCELRKELRREQYVECRSAFGGAGIYRYDAIEGNRYYVAVNSVRRDEVLCEHITFNSEVRGKLYIARKMTLSAGHRTLGSLLWQKIATDKMFEKHPKFI